MLSIFTALSVAGLLLSSVLLFQRDNRFEYDAFDSLVDAFLFSVANYHVVSPLILDVISKDSVYFNTNTGYGIATFGFLLDPLIALVPDARNLMASKVLSAEVQAFTLNMDGSEYNAFSTFLYPAVFDFGRIAGPTIYGAFFGYLIGSSLRRRGSAGFLVYVVVAYYVYFNSFTFFITGDWFWALLFVAVFFRHRAVRFGVQPAVHTT
jgi:hypothetical protein